MALQEARAASAAREATAESGATEEFWSYITSAHNQSRRPSTLSFLVQAKGAKEARADRVGREGKAAIAETARGSATADTRGQMVSLALPDQAGTKAKTAQSDEPS